MALSRIVLLTGNHVSDPNGSERAVAPSFVEIQPVRPSSGSRNSLKRRWRVRRAGTVILAVSIVLWALASVPTAGPGDADHGHLRGAGMVFQFNPVLLEVGVSMELGVHAHQLFAHLVVSWVR